MSNLLRRGGGAQVDLSDRNYIDTTYSFNSLITLRLIILPESVKCLCERGHERDRNTFNPNLHNCNQNPGDCLWHLGWAPKQAEITAYELRANQSKPHETLETLHSRMLADLSAGCECLQRPFA